MKMFNLVIVATIALFLASCGGAETKVDTGTTKEEVVTPTDTVQRVEEKKIPTAEPRSGSADSQIVNERNDILANIDKHLVTTLQPGSVTVENTLSDASFQRAIVEVSEVKDDGVEQKTDFYTVMNLEPGGKKTVKLPAAAANVKLVAHIVKAKSTELTGGEMILVGSRYTPK